MLSAARIMPVGVRLCAATSSGRTTTRPIRISSCWTRLLRPTLIPLDLMKGAKLEPQVAETEFTCKLVTIRSKKSFAEVTDALESLFKMVDLQSLADMTAAG